MRTEAPAASARTITLADVERLREQVATPKAEAAREERATDLRFHEAAAVLAWFEINPTLQPAGRDAEAEAAALAQLVRDSLCWSEESGGRRRWTLKNDIRKAMLARLATREAMERALACNPSRPSDVLQTAFEDYLRGTAKPLDEQTADELSAALQVLDWFPPTFRSQASDLPTAEDIRRRIEIAGLRAPFERLAGPHFKGRQNELAVLRDYIGVLPPSSTLQRVKRGLRQILSLHDKPPLVVSGPGGMGKSSLIARFILEHTAPGMTRLPFVYLDCDRPGLVPDEPLTLLLEAVRQLGVQFPAVRDAARSLVEAGQAMLSQDTGGILASPQGARYRRAYLDGFRAFLTDLDLGDAPLVLVLDSFEEVQYRGEAYTTELLGFLNELQGIVPRLRTVIAGRAKLTGTAYKTQDLQLASLDPEAAVGFLQAHGVTDEALAATLARQLRGNPLSLSLAVRVLRSEAAGSEGVRDLDTGGLLSPVDDTLIQGQLYRRILSHIRSTDVRKLAHPGLILRRITPDLIQRVLAEPCGVDVSSAARAEELFRELRREISLVMAGGTDQTVRHRQDVRRVMLDLLRNDKEKKDQVREIQRRAVTYYYEGGAAEGVEGRAEEIYHRLGLDEDPATVAERWIPGVEDYLLGAVEDLSGRARDFLAHRLGIEVGPALEDAAPDSSWELWAAKRAEDLLRLSRPAEALEVLRRRQWRSPRSPLFMLEARALELVGWPNEARQVAEQGIASFTAASAGNDPAVLDLYLIATRADEVLADRSDYAPLVPRFEQLAAVFPHEVRLVALGIAWIELLDRQSVGPAPADAAPIVERLRDLVAGVVLGLADEALAASPGLVRRIALEDGLGSPEVSERIRRFERKGGPTLPGAPDPSRSARRAGADEGVRVRSELSPTERQRLAALLASAIGNVSELELLSQTLFRGSLGDVTPAKTVQEAAEGIVDRAAQHNRVGELLAWVRRARPGHAGVRDFAAELGEVAYTPHAPVMTALVSGAHPFLGRHTLRSFLAQLDSSRPRTVLAVNGPPGSGKTYSVRLVDYVASATGRFDFVYMSLREFERARPRPRALVEMVAAAAGLNARTLPPHEKAPGRGDQLLVHWLLGQVMERPGILVLALDDLAAPRAEEVRAFVRELAVTVAHAPTYGLRLILLDFPEVAELQRVLGDSLVTEQLGVVARTDVEEFYRELLRGHDMDPGEFARLAADATAAAGIDHRGQLARIAQVLTAFAHTVRDAPAASRPEAAERP